MYLITGKRSHSFPRWQWNRPAIPRIPSAGYTRRGTMAGSEKTSWLPSRLPAMACPTCPNITTSRTPSAQFSGSVVWGHAALWTWDSNSCPSCSYASLLGWCDSGAASSTSLMYWNPVEVEVTDQRGRVGYFVEFKEFCHWTDDTHNLLGQSRVCHFIMKWTKTNKNTLWNKSEINNFFFIYCCDSGYWAKVIELLYFHRSLIL